jgi:transcriptional regulator with PAS, ATPase and Fis domain
LCATCSSEFIEERQVLEAIDIRLNAEERHRAQAPTENPPNVDRTDGKHILETLKNNYGNRKRTAQQLGISTSTLWRRLREIGGVVTTSFPGIRTMIEHEKSDEVSF